MIKRIIFSLLIIDLIVAVLLFANGFTKVDLSYGFIAYTKNVMREVNNFRIEIPFIPKITKLDDGTTQTTILDVLNIFINIINGIINFLNILVKIINTVIELLQFAWLLVWNLGTLTQTAQNDESTLPSVPIHPVVLEYISSIF